MYKQAGVLTIGRLRTPPHITRDPRDCNGLHGNTQPSPTPLSA